MFVNGGQRTQSQAFANFLKGGRVLIALNEIGNKVVNLSLTLGDCHARILGEYKAKSRDQLASALRARGSEFNKGE
jgi:hypothetical protein